MAQTPSSPQFVYVGTYTKFPPHVKGNAEGLYAFQMDPASGALTQAHLIKGVSNPSYIAFDPSQRHLYVVDEIDNGKVSSFAIDPATGALTQLEQHISAMGDVPCHLIVDPAGRWVLIANYTSGNIAVFPNQANGSLGEAAHVYHHKGHSVNHARQESAHAHCILVDPSGKYVLVADLGMDKVMIYRFDAATGALTPNDPPSATFEPGYGPRHIVFHPSGKYAYVIHEMGSMLSACTWDSDRGVLTPIQALPTIPADFKGETSTSAIRIHPSGKFVYGSNRGHDSIAVFQVNADGTLTAAGQTKTGGRTPRDFNIDPTGTFLLAGNQASDTITTFRIDPTTGALSPTGHVAAAMSPVCLMFYPRA